MRVLRRHNEADEARAGAADVEAEAEQTDVADRPTTGGRRTFLPGWRRSGDGASRAGDRDDTEDTVETATVDTAETGTVDARDRTAPTTVSPVTTESEIRTELWSWADAFVSVVGAALALVGLIVLARTGIDRTWYRPVVEVLNANHTAALGAAEVGAGALLILAGVARSRVAAALVGLAIAVAAALAAIETSEVRRELAIERWWAWMLAGVGLLVAVVALAPPRRSRVERVLENR